MGILVENGGILTSVQDEGRYGYQKYGMSPAGPMDPRSLYLANILVGNPMGEGALETAFMGLRLRFEEDTVIAVTGGDLTPRLNGTELPMYRAVPVKKDDVLSFEGMKNGCRAYVAFAGGLDIPLVMGSKSTAMRYKIGGYEGRKLEKGDRIGFVNPRPELPNMEKRRLPQEVFPNKETVLRVVLGPQEDCFTEKGRKQFFWYSKTITNEFDRMGCRLECDPIEHKGDGNIISDGIAFGAIQVPTNGKPIIMLADRQTVGGYTKIGSVASVDLSRLAQCKPGDKVRFVQIGLDLAQELYARQMKRIRGYDAVWNT
ncbi:MAG: biotin-dependent carboxyltransferase family protein [Clostridiales bacterium]|nr:biotin-dependent carboxyltransferase family protein [Clostridiales bacterium]